MLKTKENIKQKMKYSSAIILLSLAVLASCSPVPQYRRNKHGNRGGFGGNQGFGGFGGQQFSGSSANAGSQSFNGGNGFGGFGGKL